jgi:hypothetical protein
MPKNKTTSKRVPGHSLQYGRWMTDPVDQHSIWRFPCSCGYVSGATTGKQARECHREHKEQVKEALNAR